MPLDSLPHIRVTAHSSALPHWPHGRLVLAALPSCMGPSHSATAHIHLDSFHILRRISCMISYVLTYDIVRLTYDCIINIISSWYTTSYVRCYIRDCTYSVIRFATLYVLRTTLWLIRTISEVVNRTFGKVQVVYDVVRLQKRTTSYVQFVRRRTYMSYTMSYVLFLDVLCRMLCTTSQLCDFKKIYDIVC